MVNYYIIPIFVPHSGCPHDCSFCNQKKITGHREDITEEQVRNTINDYLESINKANANNERYIEVSFFGGSFTGIPIDYQNRLLEAAKDAKDNKLVDAIRLSTRPDYIDKAILDNLKAHGVDVIELGVQSMDQEVLNASERGHSDEDVILASNLIKSYGFKLGLQMMVGLPLSNIHRETYTAKEIIKLKPDFVRIYPALVIKDTKLEELYENGLYKPLSIDEAVEVCKVLLKLFEQNNIQIIRLGLQTTEQINLGKDVVGGPFHPAFRELVEGSIFNEMMDYVIHRFLFDREKITIEINTKDISKLFADKKRYFVMVLKKYPSKKINIRQNNTLERMTLNFLCDDFDKKMSLYEYINMEK